MSEGDRTTSIKVVWRRFLASLNPFAGPPTAQDEVLGDEQEGDPDEGWEKQLKCIYDGEFQTRDAIESQLSLPLGALTLLIGLLTYYASNVTRPPGGLWWATTSWVVVWVCLVVACWAVVVAVSFLLRAWHGFTYEALPYPSKLQDRRDSIRQYYREHDVDDEGLVNSAFRQYYTSRLIAAATKNAQNNDLKRYYLFRMRQSITTALIASAAGFIPFFHNYAAFHLTPTQKVEIVRIPPPHHP